MSLQKNIFKSFLFLSDQCHYFDKCKQCQSKVRILLFEKVTSIFPMCHQLQTTTCVLSPSLQIHGYRPYKQIIRTFLYSAFNPPTVFLKYTDISECIHNLFMLLLREYPITIAYLLIYLFFAVMNKAAMNIHVCALQLF